MSRTLTAFEKYLLFLPRVDAAEHLLECLRDGPPGNDAWELMERINGKWTCKPNELPRLVLITLSKLAQESKAT